MELLELIDRGAQHVAAHDDAAQLRHSVAKFMAVYEQFRGYSVVAASAQAERVLGAAMVLFPHVRAGGVGKTAILDVNVASGTLVARAARRLRDAGNDSDLIAIALHSLTDRQHNLLIDEVSLLVVADDRESHQSRSAELRQGRDHRIVLAG